MSTRSLCLAALMVLPGCGAGGSTDDRTFTLYRNSVTDPGMRIHVASFDANEKKEYNRDNCDMAQRLFQTQPGAKAKFWCEKGRYQK